MCYARTQISAGEFGDGSGLSGKPEEVVLRGSSMNKAATDHHVSCIPYLESCDASAWARGAIRVNPSKSNQIKPMIFISRRGKIARLPAAVREELNRRLDEGWTGKELTVWLNTLPVAQAMVAADWNGKPIREQNLSEWVHGGYRDWQARQRRRAALF